MATMTSELFLVAAALAAAPAPPQEAPYSGARGAGRATVTIMAGARIAAGEVQQSTVPAVQDSSVRAPDGEAAPARLVEFQ